MDQIETRNGQNMYEPLQAVVKRKAQRKLRKCESQSEFDGPPLPPRIQSTLPRTARSHSFDAQDFLQPPDRVSQLTNGHHSRHLSRPRNAARKTLSLQEDMLENYPTRLLDFISRFSYTLPTCIQVTNGFCSNSTDLLISQNERFNLHFIKHTRVITMHDSKYTEHYSVPLNSSVQFGLVYDPHNSSELAKRGYQFETAASIMAMHLLPVLIRATKEYKGTTPETSVEANEVLIVKGIMKKKGKFLMVQSLKHGEKHLHEKCAGHFTTAPKHIRMHVSRMIQHGITFPQRAMIFPDSETDSALSFAMAKFPVTLDKIVDETSVIASSIYESDYEVNPVMEVSLSLDIRVEPIQLQEEEQRQLSDRTHTLYHNFNASKVQLFAEMPSSKAYDLQSLLYRKLLVGHEVESTQLVLPSLLRRVEPLPYESPTHSSSSLVTPANGEMQQPSVTASSPISPLQQLILSTPLSSEGSATDLIQENVYQTIDMTKRQPEAPPPDPPYTTMRPVPASPTSANQESYAVPRFQGNEGRINTLEYNYRSLEERNELMCQKVDELMAKVDELSQSVAKTTRTHGSLEAVNLKLKEEIQDLQAKVDTATLRHQKSGSPVKPHADAAPEQNQQYITTLDCDQVNSFMTFLV